MDLLAVQGMDSQESSPTPQFKSINSLVLSFLYGPTLTSTHDHWKNYCLLCSHTAMYVCYHQVTCLLQTCSFYSKLHLKKKVLDSIKPRQLRVRGVSNRASEYMKSNGFPDPVFHLGEQGCMCEWTEFLLFTSSYSARPLLLQGCLGKGHISVLPPSLAYS